MAILTQLEKPKNSAARIANIMIRSATKNSGTPCTHVWSDAFGLGQSDDGLQVAALLSKLLKELDKTEYSLKEMKVPPHLYQNAVSALRPMLAVTNLSQPWGNISGGVAQHHVMAFRWAAHILPEENEQVNEEDLKELKRLLAEFEAALTGASVPQCLFEYLSEQVMTMKAAIAAVAVSGSSDIKAAVRKAVADAHFNDSELRAQATYTDQETANNLQSTFERLYQKGAEVAGDIEKFKNSFDTLKSFGGWLMVQLENIPSLPSP